MKQASFAEKQHPENFQFKAHEFHPYSFLKVNNKKNDEKR